MIWIIGLLFDKLANLISRCRAKYLLHSFGAHGKNVHIENHCNLTASNVFVGDNVFIGQSALFLSIGAKIIMGNNIMFGPNVSIVTGNHRTDVIGKYMTDIRVKDKRPEDDQDVIIEDDVWIGMGVIILKGVRIGKGSVIGAGTVVNKDVEPYSIVTTDRVLKVRRRFTDEEIKEHEGILKNNSRQQAET